MPYISHYGTPEQIERFIPALTAGTKIAAIAMTEPGAGRYRVADPPGALLSEPLTAAGGMHSCKHYACCYCC